MNNNQSFNTSILSKTNRLLSLEQDFITNNSDNPKQLWDMNSLAETLAYNIRKYAILHTPNDMQNTSEFQHLTTSKYVKAQRINERLLAFVLPPLLNFRITGKGKDGNTYERTASYFSSVIKESLRRFAVQNRIKPANNKCMFLICNLVDQNTPKHYIPDTDNREYHELINVFKELFVPDDSYEYASYYLDTIPIDGPDQTMVFCVLKEDFIDNVSAIRECLSGVSDIHITNQEMA